MSVVTRVIRGWSCYKHTHTTHTHKHAYTHTHIHTHTYTHKNTHTYALSTQKTHTYTLRLKLVNPIIARRHPIRLHCRLMLKVSLQGSYQSLLRALVFPKPCLHMKHIFDSIRSSIQNDTFNRCLNILSS